MHGKDMMCLGDRCGIWYKYEQSFDPDLEMECGATINNSFYPFAAICIWLLERSKVLCTAFKDTVDTDSSWIWAHVLYLDIRSTASTAQV